MTNDDLISLISVGESDTLEFKESFDREAIETCGAFSNTKVGIIGYLHSQD